MLWRIMGFTTTAALLCLILGSFLAIFTGLAYVFGFVAGCTALMLLYKVFFPAGKEENQSNEK